MIKRLLAFITSVTLLICLAACGAETPTWEPERASAEIEPYARRAIEIIDGYLNFTITTDEATAAFDELDDRISSYNVTGIDSKYSDPDRTIAHSITMLSIGDADKRTDLEYRKYRDLLAFQIGERVSGNSYEAKKSVIMGESSDLAKFIDIETTPFDYGMVSQGKDYCFVTINFEKMNGITAQDMYACAESVMSSTQKDAYEQFHLTISIGCYEQTAVYVYISDGQSFFIGNVCDAKFVSTENGETDYLYEFDSLSGLAEALDIACAFAGVK